ncbi:MAG: DotI/IcmL/TraM family protein [Candidatus Competibacteraceae bacterium]|jgi:intracellular multiplication protein IcmL|nr:DotI/IcmL/TraM family protein [Candidatus Competibacteraceae bacterium]NJN48420.1 DotI/IcmL/TraM family protein [Candidatus Competibacteraceae bacterium]
MADSVNECVVPPPSGIVKGGIRGAAPVHNLLDDYRLKLNWSLLGNGVLGIALLCSVTGHVWSVFNPPVPEYFATTADGRLIPLVPISEPYVAPEVMLTWVTQSVTQAYTLDFVHFRQQLSEMRELFTARGFRKHRDALDEAGILEAVKKRRLVTQVVATAPPIITNLGRIGNRFSWRIEVPIQVSYQGGSSQSQPQKNVVEVLVVRIPTHELARGYAIHQMITRQASGRE